MNLWARLGVVHEHPPNLGGRGSEVVAVGRDLRFSSGPGRRDRGHPRGQDSSRRTGDWWRKAKVVHKSRGDVLPLDLGRIVIRDLVVSGSSR